MFAISVSENHRDQPDNLMVEPHGLPAVDSCGGGGKERIALSRNKNGGPIARTAASIILMSEYET